MSLEAYDYLTSGLFLPSIPLKGEKRKQKKSFCQCSNPAQQGGGLGISREGRDYLQSWTQQPRRVQGGRSSQGKASLQLLLPSLHGLLGGQGWVTSNSCGFLHPCLHVPFQGESAPSSFIPTTLPLPLGLAGWLTMAQETSANVVPTTSTQGLCVQDHPVSAPGSLRVEPAR